jgi:hypothetical protein
MRKIFLTAVILTVLLTSCGTLEMKIEDPSQPTPTAADSLTAVPAPLGMDSTSDEIRRTLLDSPYHWQTIFMDAQVTESGQNPRRVQVWVDQPDLSLRVLSGPPAGAPESLRVADGMSLLDLNIVTGESNLSPFLGETLAIPYTPAPANLNSPGVIESHPLSTATDPAMGTLLFPSDIAQNEGTFKPISTEVVAYRLCLVVEWTYTQNTLPSYRAWVDISTGVFLRLQQFEKSGGTNVISEVTATRVDYNLSLPRGLFSPIITSLPDFSADPMVAASVAATPAEFTKTDPLGTVYSFVADNSQPVRVMRLVRLPASCVIGASDCPEPEVIKTPVALTSSLQPMVWSPTRNEAAWAYPITADQRIWTLYLFNAKDKSWAELASYDRTMDPPMWSRDGTWLAFRLQDGKGGSDVYAIRRDGTDMKILTASDKLPAEGKPYIMDSWLGENVILRSSKPGAPGTIYLMRVEDGFVKPLFETPLTKSPLLESPDGTLLAYVDYDNDSQKQMVKIITPDGNTLRDLVTFATGSILGLAWSPDGKQLAFAQRTDAVSIIYVINSDGRNLRQVYTSATDTQFVFSPDGNYLLVQTIDGTGEHLYSINLSTLEAHLVQAPGVTLNESWLYPAWRK